MISDASINAQPLLIQTHTFYYIIIVYAPNMYFLAIQLCPTKCYVPQTSRECGMYTIRYVGMGLFYVADGGSV